MGYKLDKTDKDLIKQLLSPISRTQPSGNNLVYDPTYDAIKEARREEDERLPQGVWKTNIKVADWHKVEALCIEALTHKTKDLQIALWLTEAWVTLQGVRGLHKSITVIVGIVDKFWKDFFPQLDDGDAEYRIALLEWMNEKLPHRIQTIQVTSPQDKMDTDLKSYTLQNWVDANYLETLIRRDDSKVTQKSAKKEGQITLDDFQKSQSATPSDFYKNLLSGAQAVQDDILKLESVLDKHISDDAPSFHKLNSLLESIQHMAETSVNAEKEQQESLKKAKKLEKKKAADAKQETSEKAKSATENSAPLPPQGDKETREKAYQQLTAIANYLESVEPQSLAPHLIRRAVEWGNMSSAEFFATLAEAKCDLNTVIQLLGLNKK